MKLFYIAGKYRSNTPHGILENIRAAEQVAIDVWRVGHAALCPHLNTSFFDGLADDKTFLDGTMLMLQRCDGIVLVPKWGYSEGARAEVRWAIAHNLPIYFKAAQIEVDFKAAYDELIAIMDIAEFEVAAKKRQ